MFNAASIAAVDAATWRGPFIRPLYDSYCFANIPQTVKHMLTGEGTLGLPEDCLGPLPHRADTVILFFIDAFGWRFFNQAKDRYPFLKHFIENGVVSKLTSQFPSTTAAHVTCIHTGLPPAQSGVYAWFQYEPRVQRMVAPLLFSFAGDTERDSLTNVNLHPNDIFPARTLYSGLKRAGIKSYVFQSRDIIHSVPARHLGIDATLVSYKTLPEALVNMTSILKKREQPTYLFFYYSALDTICHERGPMSDYMQAEIDTFLMGMEHIFMNRALGSNALFMLTADHGQMEVDPQTTIYLNHAWRDFKKYIAQGHTGQRLTPAGSPRDYYLHIKPDMLDEAQHSLSNLLTGKALVVKTADLIEQGFYGPVGLQPSETFLTRVANLVVLPYAGESVYYFERGKFDNHYYGHHGGPTREEMEIPLLMGWL